MEQTLVSVTRDLLTQAQGDMKLPEFAEKLEIPYQWLWQFISGRIDDPACSRVTSLYEQLTGTKLQLSTKLSDKFKQG